MRTISANAQAVLGGNLRGNHVKVEVQDWIGGWRDMSSYAGFDAVHSVSWRQEIESTVAVAEVEFIRESESLSIAPLVESGPNKLFDPAGTNAGLINLKRGIRISVAVIPGDREPVPGDFEVFFVGTIDDIDVAEYIIRVTARDEAGPIVDTFIERERIYAGAAVSGSPVSVRVFNTGEYYALNEYVTPTEGNRANRFYKVTTAGDSGSVEPTWPNSGSVTSLTATFTYEGTMSTTTGYSVESIMQNILNDNGLSGITLNVPTSPSWNITAYMQQRTSVWEALKTLAQQIGWDLRMKWDSSTSTFKLTFYGPNRSATTPDYTFDADDYESLDTVALDRLSVRNVIKVIFPNASLLDPAGYKSRAELTVTDASSITKYGRLFLEVEEDSTSNIDSSSEATAMANAILADLKEPKLSHTAQLSSGFPWVELNDLLRFKANGRHYSSDQDLAVQSIEHRFSEGVFRTGIACRGQPRSPYNFDAPTGIRPAGTGAGIFTTMGVTEEGMSTTSSAIVGGARIKVAGVPLPATKDIEFELHIGNTDPFTPLSSTLVERTSGREVEVSKLNPGQTYYTRFIPFYRQKERIIRGLPSAVTSFVAGRARAGHLASDVQYWRQPLNGNLDNRFGDDTRQDELPDHWELTAGSLGKEVISKYDDTAGVGNALSGKYYIRFDTVSDTGAIKSSPMIVSGGQRYVVTALAKNISGTGNWSVKVDFLKYDKTAQSSETFTQSVTADVGSWVDRAFYVTAPSAARYAAIEISTGTTSTQSFDVDSVRFDEVPEIARYYHTAGASIPNATSTIVNFDTAFDSQTNANVTTGASWKYTAPRRGYYLLQTAVTIIYNNNDTGTCYIEVFKNGSANRRIWRQSGHVLRLETQYMASCMLYLAQGDYIDVRIYQSTGGARNLEGGTQTYVEIMQIG